MNQAELAALQLEKGPKRKGLGDPPFQDAVVDVFGLGLCVCCLEGVLPAILYMMTPGVVPEADNASRVWYFERKLTDQERALMLDYFEHPGCSTARHAVYETRQLEDAQWEVDKAVARRDRIRARLPGWSVDPPEAKS